MFWVSKNFWIQNFLVKKNFGIKKVLGPKIFDRKDLGPKFVLLKKNTGRVNPMWRIYDPPLKIVVLKLCWIVVSFDW